jgi:hypothetical protein
MECGGYRVRVLPYLALMLFCVAGLPMSAQVSAYVSGNTIYYTAGGGQQSDTSFCVTAVLIDSVTSLANGNAPPCRNTPLNSSFEGCNWVGVHTVSAYTYNPNGGVRYLGDTTVTVVEPPPASCSMAPSEVRFDITDSTAEEDRRVLLSNLNVNGAGVPNFPYPRIQAFLSRDKIIPIGLRTLYNSVATPGVDVSLKVIDPADPSPYVAGGAGIVQPVPGSHPADNDGTVLPKITGTGVTDNGGGIYSVTSGANGYVSVALELDPSARAGDNYQVVATATFSDGSTKTGTSGSITAWKRMFLEKRQMYRRGAPLATDAPMGISTIVIPVDPIASSGADAFARNDIIMLMHAPGFGQPKAPVFFHSNTYRIARNPARFRAQAPVAGRGAVTTNGTPSIVGTGTRFTGLSTGEVINLASANPDELESRVIVAIADATHLTVDQIPAVTAANQPYTVGDPSLVPGRYYRRLTLDRALTETYVREPLIQPRGPLTLNDGVVRVTGGTTVPAEYFDISTNLLTGSSAAPFDRAFPAAYTEYIVLPPASGVVTPLPRRILSAGGDPNTQRFIDKWFALPTPVPLPSTDPDRIWWTGYLTPPNHQLLLVGDTDSADVTTSGSNGFLSRDLPAERASVLNRGTVEYQVGTDGPLRDATVDTVLQRTTVHEITHQWWVNDPVFGRSDHCHPQVAYDSMHGYPPSGTPPAGLHFCLMSDANAGPSMPAPWNPSVSINMIQYMYRDGHTAFHITNAGGETHSEYLSIRKMADPWRP